MERSGQACDEFKFRQFRLLCARVRLNTTLRQDLQAANLWLLQSI